MHLCVTLPIDSNPESPNTYSMESPLLAVGPLLALEITFVVSWQLDPTFQLDFPHKGVSVLHQVLW